HGLDSLLPVIFVGPYRPLEREVGVTVSAMSVYRPTEGQHGDETSGRSCLLQEVEELDANDMDFLQVSPIGYGHVLLIPRILDCLPQRLDEQSFLLAVYMAREAKTPYLRVAYNSLGAFATINHLHFQVADLLKRTHGEVNQEFLEMQINPAAWELGGYMVVKRSKDYQETSEETLWRFLDGEASVSAERFNEIKECILSTLSDKIAERNMGREDDHKC
ncbi:hypothetical protein B296_00057127, partial [Ensete ventricosum]